MKTHNLIHRLGTKLLLVTASGLLCVCAARADYQSTVLSDLPAGYWPLDLSVDTSGSATDLSGNANAGTYMNISSPANQTAGPSAFIPNAVSFNGTSAYVSLPDASLLNIGGVITMEAWVQPAASQNHNPADILAKGWENGGNWGEDFLNVYNGNFQGGRDGGNYVVGSATTTSWTHEVCTYDGAKWNFYLNGTLVGTKTDSQGASVANIPWAIGNGTSGGNGRYFNGNICQVALYNTALSADRVLAHYYQGMYGTLGHAPTIAVQPVSHTFYANEPAALSVTATGTEPLGYQWLKGTTPLAGQNSALLSINPAQPADAGQYSVIVTNNFGSVTSSVATLTLVAQQVVYENSVLSDSPVGYWPLDLGVDASGSAADLSGNGNVGTYVNISSSANQQAGPSAYIPIAAGFDGRTAYVSLPNASLLNLGGPITMEAWVQAAVSQNNDPADILGKGWQNGGNWGEDFLSVSGGHFRAGRDSGNYIDGSATTTNWTHVVATHDGANWNLYLNGILAGTHADSQGASMADIPWAIGNGTSGGNNRYFNGNICQVALYASALAADRVLAHYLIGMHGAVGQAPAINAQPVSSVVRATAPARFVVGVVGTPPLSYQWFKGASSLTDQTNTTLLIASAQVSDVGNYSVIVSNTWGSVTSSVVSLALQTTTSAYEGVVLADSPIGYWPLDLTDGNTLAIDFSAHGNDGTYQNISLAGNNVPGPSASIPNAVSFNGSTAYVGLGTGINPALLDIAGIITMEAWVQPAASQSHDPADILAKGYQNGGNWGEDFLNVSGGKLQGGRDGGNYVVGSAATTNWTHQVCTYDGAKWNLYLNGQLVGTKTDSQGASAASIPWAIGNGTSGGNGRYFNGNICQAALYNSTLTLEQVLAHYLMGTIGTTNVAPVITGQPTSQRVPTNSTASFTVTAMALPLPTYQWYLVAGGATNAIAGANSATYITPPVQDSDSGNGYFVIVTNRVGTVVSHTATLTAGHLVATSGNLECDQYFGNYSSALQAFGALYPTASSLPAPNRVEYLTSFNSHGNLPNNSGERIHGWFTPPSSGNYVFFVACDDASALWLSTNSDPANVCQIAQNEAWMWSSAGPDWTCSNTGSAEYAYYGTGEWRSDQFELGGGLNAYGYLSGMWSPWPGLNADGSIPLVGGQKYYIELDHYQGTGGQSAAVTYKLAGDPDPNPGAVTLLSGNVITTFVPDTMLPKPQPLITDIHSSGANMILSGSNGLVNAVYNVLTSTNVSAPLTNWTVLATQRFDASGKFSSTNTITAGNPQQFYLIQTPN